MALDDVVQGVKVQVTTEGVDDAKSKLNELEQSIDRLAKSAGVASGGSGGSGPGRGSATGVPALTDAMTNLRLAGAGAFQQIAEGVASGNITGLATLMGGPVAGGVAVATKALYDFMKSQEAAVLSNSALAKELGTTPDVVQSLGDSFAKAGVSGMGFHRLISRMSRDVSNDYASMMHNIRTDSDKSAEAQLALVQANQKLRDSFSDTGPQTAEQGARSAALGVERAKEALAVSQGVPKESFAAQDKILDQKEKQLALDTALTKQEDADKAERNAQADKDAKRQQAEIDQAKAQEAVRQQALHSIPHITELLQNMGDKSADVSDLMETDMHTLRDSIMNLSRPPGGGQADPLNYLKSVMDVIKQVHDLHPELDTKMQGFAQELMGMGARAGMGVQDPGAFLKMAQEHGSAEIDSALAGRGELKSLGLTQTTEDTENAEKAREAMGRISELFSGMAEKIGAALTKISLPDMQAFGDALAKIAGIFTGHTEGTKSAGDLIKELFPGFMPQTPGPNGETGPSSRQEGVKDVLFGPSDQPTGTLSSIMRRLAGGDDKQSLSAVFGDFFRGQTRSGAGGTTGEDKPVPFSGIPAQEEPTTTVATAPAVSPNITVAPSITVNVNGTSATATVAPQSGTEGSGSGSGGVQGGHWRGGAIRGFAGGGRVRRIPGFAMGGVADPMFLSATEPLEPLLGDSPVMEQKRRVMQINNEMLLAGGNSLMASSDEEGRRVNRTNDVGSASSALYDALFGKAGGGIIGFAEGGLIPGFAIGGQTGVAGPAYQVPDDPLAAAQKRVAEAEYQLSIAKGPHTIAAAKLELAEAKRALADLNADEGQLQRARNEAQRRQQAADRAKAAKLEEAKKKFAADKEDNALEMKLGSGIDRMAGKSVEDYLWTGGVPGFAVGGVRGPGTGTSDSILARLSNGEFVMKAAAVRNYGEHFMNAINNLQIPPPRYAMGGMVPTTSLPRFAEGGGVVKPGSILNLHIDTQSFMGLKAPDAVATQLRKFAIGQHTTSTGKKPSWAAGG